MNRKLSYRLYREAGLAVRRRKRKRIGPFETPGFGASGRQMRQGAGGRAGPGRREPLLPEIEAQQAALLPVRERRTADDR